MTIYEFEAQEGYEWVVPVNPADFELFRSLDGHSKAANWRPVKVKLLREDEGRPLMESAGLPYETIHAS
jgi:hypothetical protein